MSNETTLDDVLALLDTASEGDYLSRRESGTNIALRCAGYLREHGPAIKAALEDAVYSRMLRRYYMQESPLHDAAWGALCGPYTEEHIDAAQEAGK